MGYINKTLGIKSGKGLAKYLTEIFDKEFMVIKVANSLRIIWAINDKLCSFDIKASVIYVIKEEEVEEAILHIKNSLYGN